MIRIDARRFFALSASLAAACSPTPSEPPAAPELAPTPTVLVAAEDPVSTERSETAAATTAAPDAGVEGAPDADSDGGRFSGLEKIVSGIQPPGVLRQIQDARPSLRRCYQTELARDPNFEADLLVELTIAGGKVISVSFARASTSTGFDACIGNALRALSFPTTPDGGRTVVKLPLRMVRG